MNPSEFSFHLLNHQKNDRWVRITRGELYEKVWAAPMVVVAKEFGISDRGLAKTCARLEVPVPPRGYWAKLRAGQRVSKTPLHAPKPMTAKETVILRTLGSKSVAKPPEARDPGLQARIDAALASARPVKVPRTLSNPHVLIRQWIDEDRRAREQARESVYAPVHLSITRTEIERRRLRILTALLGEFERIGYSVRAEREKQKPVVVRSRSASLNFVLFEPARRVRIPLTEKAKNDSWNQGRDWRYQNQPSRELLLRIESYLGKGERTEWRDEAETRLEGRIDEVIAGLLTGMALVEDHEQKRRDEEQRRWNLEEERAQRERRRKLEEARWKHVADLAQSARQANMIREFLDALEQRALSAAGEDGLSARLQNWFVWARKRADAADPMLSSPESYAPENLFPDDFSDCDQGDAQRNDRVSS